MSEEETFSFTGYEYDPELEEKEYSRSLLSQEELILLKTNIEENGFMTINQIRELVKQNNVKESQEARGETYAVDSELMLLIDSRTNFPIFISGDNVYTREELIRYYPFEEFRIEPENVFIQQEIGVFPPGKYQMQDDTTPSYEYVARDLGSEEEFTMIDDLVRSAINKKYDSNRSPLRIIKTKIFLGKEKWDDFKTMKRFVNSFSTFVAPLMLQNPDNNPASAIGRLFGMSIQSAQDEERKMRIQEKEQKALEALEEKAKTIQQQEEDLKKREKELYDFLGIDPP